MLALQHGLTLHAERLFYPADIRARLSPPPPRPRMLVTTPVHLRILLSETESPPPVDLVLCATAPLPAQLATPRRRTASRRCCMRSMAAPKPARSPRDEPRAPTSGNASMASPYVRTTPEPGPRACPSRSRRSSPDVIELRGPTRFACLHGRIADMVNVAGKRTSLVHLNYHLNAIDGVHDGAFRSVPMTRRDRFRRPPDRVRRRSGTQRLGFILSELRRRIDAARFCPGRFVWCPSCRVTHWASCAAKRCVG